jgi:hypothetical protein
MLFGVSEPVCMSTVYMSDRSICILQNGSEVFAFFSDPRPGDKYPKVLSAWAMMAGSADTKRIGLKPISRPRFEWIVKHYACHVNYVGTVGGDDACIFYCQSHNCWELHGEDFYPLSVAEDEKEEGQIFKLEPHEEDREI